MTEFQIYALDASSGRVSVCRDTKDFTNQQGRGKFQVSLKGEMVAFMSCCRSHVIRWRMRFVLTDRSCSSAR